MCLTTHVYEIIITLITHTRANIYRNLGHFTPIGTGLAGVKYRYIRTCI